MKYPVHNYLNKKRGYTFGVKTSYSDFHLGEDLIGEKGEPIYAIDNGIIINIAIYPQGGLTIHLKLERGELIRYLHLQKTEFTTINVGGIKVKAGQKIGTMGSSGSLSTNTHLHWDVSKNGKLELDNLSNFTNPLLFIKELLQKPMNDKIIRNQKTGEFAYIQGGKRRTITAERAGFAMITVWTKGWTPKDNYQSLTDEEFNKIPKGKDF